MRNSSGGKETISFTQQKFLLWMLLTPKPSLLYGILYLEIIGWRADQSSLWWNHLPPNQKSSHRQRHAYEELERAKRGSYCQIRHWVPWWADLREKEEGHWIAESVIVWNMAANILVISFCRFDSLCATTRESGYRWILPSGWSC